MKKLFYAILTFIVLRLFFYPIYKESNSETIYVSGKVKSNFSLGFSYYNLENFDKSVHPDNYLIFNPFGAPLPYVGSKLDHVEVEKLKIFTYNDESYFVYFEK